MLASLCALQLLLHYGAIVRIIIKIIIRIFINRIVIRIINRIVIRILDRIVIRIINRIEFVKIISSCSTAVLSKIIVGIIDL